MTVFKLNMVRFHLAIKWQEERCGERLNQKRRSIFKSCFKVTAGFWRFMDRKYILDLDEQVHLL